MKTILAPIDFSDVTETIVEKAAEMAKAFNASLRLFHVAGLQPDLVGFFAEAGFVGPLPGPDELEKAMAQQTEALKKIEAPLRAQGLVVSSSVIQGSPTQEIINESQRIAADLIIVGSHGHGALYHLMLGSISEGVLRQATCPILVVHSQPNVDKRA